MLRTVVTLFSISLLFLTGCSFHTPVPLLLPSDYCRNDSGYIYGRFNLAPSPDSCVLGVELVLLNHNSKDREYVNLPFRKSDDVIGIPVTAGEYSVDSVAFLNENGSQHSRKRLEGYKGTFRIENGKAYYVGDYEAVTSCTPAPQQGHAYSWNMKEVDSNFIRTTADFSKKHVYFGSCEKLPIIGK